MIDCRALNVPESHHACRFRYSSQGDALTRVLASALGAILRKYSSQGDMGFVGSAIVQFCLEREDALDE
jgi:hypothetical protein